MRLSLFILIAGLAACASIAGAMPPETSRYTVFATGEAVGHMAVETRDGVVTIDYRVRNNGRGPTLTERVVTGDGGAPSQWEIDGTTAFGGPVHERFERRSGTATWTAQSGRGSAPAPASTPYVPADSSPWAYWVYARALLDRPGHELQVLPTGSLRLNELRRVAVGDGARARDVIVYALDGLGLTPNFVMLDDEGQLFATVDTQPAGLAGSLITIREGYETARAQLAALVQELRMERARQLQQRLSHRFARPVTIRNVRLFDPQGLRLEGPMRVTIEGERIIRVEPERQTAPSADHVVIDGEGGVLMAGLHDMHSHTTIDTGPLYLAAGVTTTRDLGNDNESLLAIVAEQEAGRLAGPRIIRAGLIEGRSPFSARIGIVAGSEAEAVAAVRWYAERGYQQIKIYNSVHPDWVAPIAAEAHRLGMRVSGHVPAFMSADEAIRAGYDELTHINLLMLSWVLGPGEDTRTPLRVTAMDRAANLDLSSPRVRATLDLMVANHIALDPTAVIFERLLLSRAGEVQRGDLPYLDHMPVGYQRYRRRSFINIETPEQDAAYRAAVDKALDVIRLAVARGIQILPGTDDVSGVSVHRELELYAMAGLPAPQILRLATLDVEHYFGREADYGSIEPGKRADLILLAADPTVNISAVRQVRMTMRGGIVYFPAEIYDALGIRPFAPAPLVHLPGAGAR